MNWRLVQVTADPHTLSAGLSIQENKWMDGQTDGRTDGFYLDAIICPVINTLCTLSHLSH